MTERNAGNPSADNRVTHKEQHIMKRIYIYSLDMFATTHGDEGFAMLDDGRVVEIASDDIITIGAN